MLVLFETAAGFALFRVLNESKLKKVQDFSQEFSSVESAQKMWVIPFRMEGVLNPLEGR